MYAPETLECNEPPEVLVCSVQVAIGTRAQSIPRTLA